MSDPTDGYTLIDATDVTFGGEVKRRHIEHALASIRRVPRVTEVVVGSLLMAQALAGLDEPLPPHLAQWIEVPPPTVRQGLAVERRREKRRAHAKMRQRRRGDRAGRPL